MKTTKLILNSQRGMSLIEILIALTLLAVAGTMVTTTVLDRLDEGNKTATVTQIRNIGTILLDYKRKCGLYPTSDQGLQALVEKPTGGKECKRYPSNGFIEGGKVPQDAWETEFYYESDGRKYTIISYGKDQEEGGEEEYDADINSNDL
jgi:general secretion pathway protein G